MGMDISGFIECRMKWYHDEPWRAAIDLSLLYGDRDYEAFGCLFGMRPRASFRPLAAHRGLPPDASAPVRAEVAEYEQYEMYCGSTWISWAEALAVDWGEPTQDGDQGLFEYRRQADGTLRSVGRVYWSPALEAETGLRCADVLTGESRWEQGGELVVGDTVIRAEPLRRRHAVPPDGNWKYVWRVMEILAARNEGPDNVRLVVSFHL